MSRTGISSIHYDRTEMKVVVPTPHNVTLTTDKSNDRFVWSIRDSPEKGMPVTIRFDGNIESIDKAIVGMTLETYAELLRAYTIVEGRPDAASENHG